MAEERLFHIGDVLSVTTGVLLSPEGMTGVAGLLGYMEGAHLDFGLPDAAMRCTPLLLDAHPFLRGTVPPLGVAPAVVEEWLAGIVDEYGETLAVPRAPWHTGEV